MCIKYVMKCSLSSSRAHTHTHTHTHTQREDKLGRLEELKLEQEKLSEEVERLKQEKEVVEEPERLAIDEHKKVMMYLAYVCVYKV